MALFTPKITTAISSFRSVTDGQIKCIAVISLDLTRSSLIELLETVTCWIIETSNTFASILASRKTFGFCNVTGYNNYFAKEPDIENQQDAILFHIFESSASKYFK